MDMKRHTCLIIAWLFAHGLSVICGIEISFDNPRDGYFLKSTYDKYHLSNPDIQKETFIITNPSDSHKILAQYGPFEVYQSVPSELLEDVHNFNQSSSSNMHQQVLYNMDVSAHIVSEDVTIDRPVLQVLVHATPIPLKGRSPAVMMHYRQTQRWCGQVFAHFGDRQISDVCIIGEKNACVSSLSLPVEWWDSNSTIVGVYYSFSRVDQNSECASASNSIVPERSFTKTRSNPKEFLATINLSPSLSGFTERKIQQLLVYIPWETFYPGTVFQVPVRLEARSKLKEFVMRVRVRPGLKVTDVSKPDGPWSVYVEMNEKQRMATVTAYVTNPDQYSPSSRIQDLFKWQFVVDETLTGKELGRLVWSVSFEKNSKDKDFYMSQESRMVTNINLAGRKVEKIVPVFKLNEIINLAILNGKPQVYPLYIYSVGSNGEVHDITFTTHCHSIEENVLKVARNCSYLYVDGSETKGSHNATLIAKAGRHTSIFYVKVWIPEERLQVELSDSKLSQIRGWKIPDYTPRQRRNTYGKLMSDAPSKSGDKKTRKCRLKSQQALITVYTRFFISTPIAKEYFKSENAWFRITDVVQERLRTADKHIAVVHGHVVHGVGTGGTEVQVLSPGGRLLGTRAIQVGKDKVVVERLLISLVTGVMLDLQHSEQIPGLLTAIAHIQSKLQGKYQEGVMDVSVQYSDGSRMPLRYINPEYYALQVTTRNHNIVGVAPYVTPYQPRIVALGQGRGEFLKVILKLGSHCLRKKSRSLGESRLTVTSDFSQEANYLDRFQSDAHYDNRASDRWDGYAAGKPDFNYDVKSKNGYFKSQQKIKNSKSRKKQKDNGGVPSIPVDIAFADIPELPVETQPHTEAHQQHVADTVAGSTPLQIGMYVLLSVFSVAIVVFMVNCVVFMVRYKRKRKPKVIREKVSSANDWVWMGRATLERNRVNTQCSHALMPEEDFNGNHMTVIPSSQSGSQSGRSSGSSFGGNSNRNSVSTYKGSECSIRITSNPLLEATSENSNANALPPEAREWDYEAMGMTYDQLMDYFANLKESTA